ncbi:hypothetical protein NNJEOMEG_03852 [Fundidesulfovibrio magnetotacticus]|uniref:PilZ domain-containing protein n=1 Tax=Fundidesulfovibrio magnetotacticus TaxID=2730080 RepID=A0A6V8M0I7_9BACT|nr:PilZ domain-containing protein [Fundidesulfovibrio magnetotacticus]GFK95978.1 hypothetical protein NNJEOMEG_03852 [Fundidesulfovibrio magnetotacticus]
MDERRYYNRVPVSYHANGYDCTINIEGKLYSARLMDISQGGAKLEVGDLYGGDAYKMDGAIIDDYYEQPYLAGKYYTVAWHKDEYIGISFSEPLSRSYDALYDYYAATA